MIYTACIFQNSTVRVTEISQFLNITKMIRLIFLIECLMSQPWCYHTSSKCQMAYTSVL